MSVRQQPASRQNSAPNNRTTVDCMAEFEYVGQEEDELSMKPGDIISDVAKMDGGWWEGTMNGKRGMFPDNFVKEDVKKEEKKARELPTVAKKCAGRGGGGSGHVADLASRAESKKVYAKVTYAYSPQQEDELKLDMGATVEITKQEEDGWWEGTLNGKSGVFPSNFVELIEEPTSSDSKEEVNASATKPRGFRVGDKVTIDRDLDHVKRSQNGHGGWHSDMKKMAKTPGTVTDIDSDGDLKVKCGDNNWTLNPEVCHKARESESETPTKKKNVNKTGNESVTSLEPSIEAGDTVTLDRDVDFVKRMQKGHGGWNDAMKKVMSKIGTVNEVDSDGDIVVIFDDAKWTVNPEVCRKVKEEPKQDVKAKVKDKNVNVDTTSSSPVSATPCKFSVGEQVRIVKDVEYVKDAQKGHGGWNDGMKDAMDKVGKVLNIDGDGDITVDFAGTQWTLNPDACVKSQNFVSSKKDINQASVSVTSQTSKPVPAKKPVAASRSECFSIGDQVKIADIPDEELKSLQSGHGGWNPAVSKAKNSRDVGMIKDVDSDGDIKVTFTSGTLTINPKACVSLDPAKAKPSQPAPGGRELQGQNSTNFSPGDCVKIALDVDVVVLLQEGHGGWGAAMEKSIGQVGVVQDVMPSGDLKVKYGTNCWTFNPAVLLQVDSSDNSKLRRTKDNNENRNSSHRMTSKMDKYRCPVCLDGGITIVFNCGHGTCETCSKSMDNCHMCRLPIALRTKMFI